MKKGLLLGTAIFGAVGFWPAYAQQGGNDEGGSNDEIIVTAQRVSQSLQDVPIAVSAFSAEALERQQIENASDLQLTLPNVTFTKGNFTGSSFTIRGIGDLCVGTTCDSATGIHANGTPLLATRLFETEYFDLDRIEVLRGPQGTLFGRNATSGVVNFVTAKPDMNGFAGSVDGEYGNFNAIKLKAMMNAPLSDTLAVRLAGFYLKRDGYTKNIYDDSRVDGRGMYALRGSLRWEPTPDTTIDLMGYYFREKDDRTRSQKQLCQRDPTGILGCTPGGLDYSTTNGNATLAGVLGSSQLLAISGVNAIAPTLGLGSLYGPDVYANSTNPADLRTINTDYNPTYFAKEQQYQARIEHDFGKVKAQLTGFYHKAEVDSSQDYNNAIQDRSGYATALNTLSALAANPSTSAYFGPISTALTPNGANGDLCTSLPEETGTGAFGGHRYCSSTPQDFDRSVSRSRDWSIEGIVSTDLDGPLNFLLGAIHVDAKTPRTDYYVNSFSLDYISGILGSAATIGAGVTPSYRATPYYRNNTDFYSLKSNGIFGEGYFQANDKLNLTVGLRYNHDKKYSRARTTLYSDANQTAILVPYSATSVVSVLDGFDFDPGTTGNQAYQERRTSFSEFTGRAVVDYKLSEDNLLYASYSRGYKSGGINPPLSLGSGVPETFKPEFVDAFEIGSKNTTADGTLSLNLTGFYYKYKDLQLSRIVQRTSVNDNIDADIYGAEAEALIRPDARVLINLNFSYLKTKITSTTQFTDTRDPSGGRTDAVIIKDITNGSNCAVTSNAGSAAAAQGFVGAVNGGLGLRAPAAFADGSGINATGAYSICSVLRANAGANFSVTQDGLPISVQGNKLPQSPNFKFSAGAQYTAELSSGMTLVPRADLTYTGESYATIFNTLNDRIQGYAQVNAQLQLNGRDDRWYVRGYVQNLLDSDAITGKYSTDQSSGLFTNVFTLEPRRFGIAAGFKF